MQIRELNDMQDSDRTQIEDGDKYTGKEHHYNTPSFTNMREKAFQSQLANNDFHAFEEAAQA